MAAALIALFASIVARAEDLPPGEADWRAERLAELKAPLGWLNLVGLAWLGRKPLAMRSKPPADLVLAGLASDWVVTKDLNDRVLMRKANQSHVVALDPADIERSDLELGRYYFRALERDGKIALRAWDIRGGRAAGFEGIGYFEFADRWRVTATFEPAPLPTEVNVPTVIKDLMYRPQIAGWVSFEYDGSPYALEAYDAGDQLFLVFGDQTNRDKRTYPGGRYLYVDKPSVSGSDIVLNFNRAESPPCAFSDFATCPLPRPVNRLKLAVTAGEQY